MATKRLPMRHIREILRLKYEQQPPLGHRRRLPVEPGNRFLVSGRARRAGLEWPLYEALDDTALLK